MSNHDAMKVLVADDDPVSQRLLQMSLSNAGYPVVTACNGTEALRLLEEKDGPQLAVLDWMMPEMDGVEVCRIIRKAAREPYVYILLLTARGHQTEIIQGLEAGADDYITKPFDLPELKARLRTGQRIVELQGQLIGAREQLRIQANHDSLTGIFNRTAILEVLEKEFVRSRRAGDSVAVMMADIDHFKSVNDTHGHQAGDIVLRETARKMLASVRRYDSIGRYGGEEFLLIAPGCELAAVVPLAERIREFVSAQAIEVDGLSIPTTISIGVAASCDAQKPSQLLRAADEALYVAKKEGRNRVAVTSEDRAIRAR
jgi:two-component system cell cycle response regulator